MGVSLIISCIYVGRSFMPTHPLPILNGKPANVEVTMRLISLYSDYIGLFWHTLTRSASVKQSL